MHFKIRNTEVKISFTFFALILLFSTNNNFRMYLLFLIVGLIHESVHLFFIFKFSAAPEKITVSLFGANIVRNSSTSVKNTEEFIINISAPFFNLFLGFLMYVSTVSKTLLINEFVVINIVLGCFNLLPFYNLDGGNALRNLLLLKYEENKTEKIIICTSIVVAFAFTVTAFFVILRFKSNFSLLIITLYFILSLLFKK